jgi:hypothetical protein
MALPKMCAKFFFKLQELTSWTLTKIRELWPISVQICQEIRHSAKEQQLSGKVEAKQIQPAFWSTQSSPCHNAILTWFISLHKNSLFLTEVDGCRLHFFRGSISEDLTQAAPIM